MASSRIIEKLIQIHKRHQAWNTTQISVEITLKATQNDAFRFQMFIKMVKHKLGVNVKKLQNTFEKT